MVENDSSEASGLLFEVVSGLEDLRQEVEADAVVIRIRGRRGHVLKETGFKDQSPKDISSGIRIMQYLRVGPGGRHFLLNLIVLVDQLVG